MASLHAVHIPSLFFFYVYKASIAIFNTENDTKIVVFRNAGLVNENVKWHTHNEVLDKFMYLCVF